MTADNFYNSSIGRRRFLKIAVGAVAGGVGLAVFGGVREPEASNAARLTLNLQGHSQLLDKFLFEGETVEIMRSHGQEMLYINGVPLPEHVFSKTDAGYVSHMFPFENFRSARELAKQLVDGNSTFFILSPMGGM